MARTYTGGSVAKAAIPQTSQKRKVEARRNQRAKRKKQALLAGYDEIVEQVEASSRNNDIGDEHDEEKISADLELLRARVGQDDFLPTYRELWKVYADRSAAQTGNGVEDAGSTSSPWEWLIITKQRELYDEVTMAVHNLAAVPNTRTLRHFKVICGPRHPWGLDPARFCAMFGEAAVQSHKFLEALRNLAGHKPTCDGTTKVEKPIGSFPEALAALRLRQEIRWRYGAGRGVSREAEWVLSDVLLHNTTSSKSSDEDSEDDGDDNDDEDGESELHGGDDNDEGVGQNGTETSDHLDGAQAAVAKSAARSSNIHKSPSDGLDRPISHDGLEESDGDGDGGGESSAGDESSEDESVPSPERARKRKDASLLPDDSTLLSFDDADTSLLSVKNTQHDNNKSNSSNEIHQTDSSSFSYRFVNNTHGHDHDNHDHDESDTDDDANTDSNDDDDEQTFEQTFEIPLLEDQDHDGSSENLHSGTKSPPPPPPQQQQHPPKQITDDMAAKKRAMTDLAEDDDTSPKALQKFLDAACQISAPGCPLKGAIVQIRDELQSWAVLDLSGRHILLHVLPQPLRILAYVPAPTGPDNIDTINHTILTFVNDNARDLAIPGQELQALNDNVGKDTTVAVTQLSRGQDGLLDMAVIALRLYLRLPESLGQVSRMWKRVCGAVSLAAPGLKRRRLRMSTSPLLTSAATTASSSRLQEGSLAAGVHDILVEIQAELEQASVATALHDEADAVWKIVKDRHTNLQHSTPQASSSIAATLELLQRESARLPPLHRGRLLQTIEDLKDNEKQSGAEKDTWLETLEEVLTALSSDIQDLRHVKDTRTANAESLRKIALNELREATRCLEEMKI
ncbi:hypothetical protein Slin15195_G130060 [Septoria linicola]|uniref:Uncharacterized protein n=1 Tax=Septoria linicola TaxID=215465 RepID=A0A9Q9ERA1_9PEZI|nr:hypothetical protein Slin14017_G121950 [Septoria linicola]USW59687.1 hypothetical protein Slin15195_G130060 [Septoria linicola]